jgi:hypothetical protein
MEKGYIAADDVRHVVISARGAASGADLLGDPSPAPSQRRSLGGACMRPKRLHPNIGRIGDGYVGNTAATGCWLQLATCGWFNVGDGRDQKMPLSADVEANRALIGGQRAIGTS